MKYKVNFLNKDLLNKYYNVLSVISVITSFIFLVCDIPDSAKFLAGSGMLIVFASIYILMWTAANRQKKIILNMNKSTIEICEGDLFACDGFKVIAFNEYFDTLVDDVHISSCTINGKYIQTYITNVDDLDAKMAADPHLQSRILETTSRSSGKNTKYALGTVFRNGDYLLMAFSKFDNDNRAYLEINDYIQCLMNFWKECDIYFAGQSISIPLFGTGITRFRGYENVTEQELLELILWTFHVSRIRLNVKIVLTSDLLKKVNLYCLKDRFPD